jgi:hypothetical protein
LLLVNSNHFEYLAKGPRLQGSSRMYWDWYGTGPIRMPHNGMSSLPVYVPTEPLQSADKLPGPNLQIISLLYCRSWH